MTGQAGDTMECPTCHLVVPAAARCSICGSPLPPPPPSPEPEPELEPQLFESDLSEPPLDPSPPAPEQRELPRDTEQPPNGTSDDLEPIGSADAIDEASAHQPTEPEPIGAMTSDPDRAVSPDQPPAPPPLAPPAPPPPPPPAPPPPPEPLRPDPEQTERRVDPSPPPFPPRPPLAPPPMAGGTFAAIARRLVTDFNFKGRMAAGDFWKMFAARCVVGVVGLILMGSDEGVQYGDEAGPFALLIFFVLCIVGASALAEGTRRLHDTGKSGAWNLLLLIPVLGVVPWIALCAMEGERGPNQFGPPPLAEL